VVSLALIANLLMKKPYTFSCFLAIFAAFSFATDSSIAFLRKMRYDVTDLNEVKNIEP